MVDDWSTVTLRQAGVELIDCEHKTPPAADTGYPYIAIPQMKEGRIDLTGVRLITEEDFELWTTKAKPEAHDVVLSRRCNPGVTAHIPPGLSCALGQNLVLLRSNGQRVDKRYLRWLVQGEKWWEQIGKFINVGAVFDSLRCADVPNFELPIPPLPEQRRIAAILGALDDKIELNRRMNKTLEEMASAIFKSWFVDFDGVIASGGDLVESELGLIPRGWEVKPVTTLVEFNPRLKLQRGADATFAEMKALPTDSATVGEVVRKPFCGGGAKFQQGDTLLARITPCLENGKTALVDFLDGGEVGFGSTEFIVMRGQGAVGPEFVYCLARSEGFRSHAIANMTGSSGRQRVQGGAFDHYPVPLPDVDLLDRFTQLAQPIFRKISANARESRTLAELRDTLLSKLISGDLRVPEAEKAVEGAA